MDLAKWDPSRTLAGLKDDVNALFERFFEGRGLPSLLERTWSPAVDVAETDENLVVSAELPGMSAEDINVSVTGESLTIKGEKNRETVVEGQDLRRAERSYGAFSRTIRLQAAVKPDEAQASFKNGILTITLPKAEGEIEKTIKVNRES